MRTSDAAQDEARALGGAWWLLSLTGLLSVAAGVLVLFKPGNSLPTLAVIAGIFILFDGILELVASFSRDTANRGLVAISGVLSLIVGIMLVRHPIAGVAAVALLIGIWMVVVGTVRLVASFEAPEHRAWRAVVGIVEILAGIVIVATPEIGFATLALLVGIGFVVNGVAMVAIGWKVHELRAHDDVSGHHHVGPAPA